MGNKIKDIILSLEKYAPVELAEPWDNVGLMVGDVRRKVEKVLICLDITSDIIDEAEKLGCGLIITHHPFIFHKMGSIDLTKGKGMLIEKLINKGIAVYSAHTNLDYAKNGVNFCFRQYLQKAFEMDCESVNDFARKINKVIETEGIGVIGEGNRAFKKFISQCGAFDGNIDGILESGADVLVTGEIKYNDAVDLVENGITIIEVGHYYSEKTVLSTLCDYLKELNPETEFCLTKVPFKYTILH